MKRVLTRMVVVAAAAVFCNAALAVLPLLAGLGKQILQNIILGEVKGQLIGSLAQMGCKGAAIASLVAQADLKHAANAMPKAPLPSAIDAPGGGATANAANAAGSGGLFGSLRDALRSVTGGGASAGAAASTRADPADAEAERVTGGRVRPVSGNVGVAEKAPDLASAISIAQREMAAGSRASPLGALSGMDAVAPPNAAQASQMTAALGQMQQAMSQPLSRAETLEVFDDLGQMGILTPALRSEARDCILLAPPAAQQSLGQTGALFKTMLIPQLLETRAQLAGLPPEQQQQLADELTDALREAAPQDRKAMRDGLGAGFFPPVVMKRVRASGVLD